MCVCVFLFSLWKGPLARGAYVTKARDSIEGMACCAHPPDDDADVMRISFFFFVFLQSKFTRIVEDVDKYKNNFQCARDGWGVSGEKWRKSESEIKKIQTMIMFLNWILASKEWMPSSGMKSLSLLKLVFKVPYRRSR